MSTSCQKCITVTPPQGLSVQTAKQSSPNKELVEQYSKLSDCDLLKVENTALKVIAATAQAQLAIRDIQRPACCGNALDCKA